MSLGRTTRALGGVGAFVAVALAVSAGQTPQPKEKKAADLKELLPRIEPLSPEAALKSLKVEKGFRVELAAAEPEVVDPIALAWDEDGRLYVAEDIDYPLPAKKGEKPLGRVRRLTDRDGDGRYETSVVFADGLQWPSGIAPWKGGVFVTAPSQVLYLKDTDGDGRADVRRVVFDGFGTQTGEDIMNNLRWGLDHKIYGVTSYNGGNVTRPGRSSEKPVSVRMRDFRFDPRTERFEAITGTGDFGNRFDDWGNRFVGNAGQLLIHPVLPAHYLARNPILAAGATIHNASASKRLVAQISPPEPWRVVRQKYWERWVNSTPDMRASRFSEAELATSGHVTGAAGGEIYRGNAYPAEYRGDSFTAEPAGNVVVRLKVKPNGPTFEATAVDDNREFLASADNWFRPVNVVNGPDGCLYVCDMYREIIEDPSAIPEDILKVVDVTAGRDRGRIYRIVPETFARPKQPKLGGASADALAAALEHPNAWWRETAQRLLVERQEKRIVDRLRQRLRDAEMPQARLHLLHTLAGLGALEDRDLLAALNDRHAAVREHGVQLSEGRLSESAEILDRVVAMANGEGARVRFQVAFSLGEGPKDARTAKALAVILDRDLADRWTPTAVLSSVGEVPALLFDELLRREKLVKSERGAAILAQLAAVAAARKDRRDLDRVLAAAVTPPIAERPDLQRGLLLAAADALASSGEALPARLEAGGAALEPAAKAFRTLLASAAETAGNADAKLPDRLTAVRLLRHADFKVAGPKLGELLHAEHPPELQIAAVQALSARREKEVGPLLLDRWRGISPRCRGEAVEAFFRDPARLPLLLDGLENRTVQAGDLPLPRRQGLLKHADEKVRARAEKALAGSATAGRREVLEKYQQALKLSGDVGRGREVFVRNCAACHKLGTEGRNVGPDLAGVQRRTPDELLVAILDPSREVAGNYVNYLLTTKDGRQVSGIIVAETAGRITLRRGEGAEDSVARDDVESLRSSGQSLMPEGLEQQIDLQQMADLLKFMSRAR